MARLGIVRNAPPVMLVFLVLVLCGNGVQSQDNSGLQVRMSQSALQFGISMIGTLFEQEALKSQIPNQSGVKSAPIGAVNYEVTNIQVTNFVKPLSNVVVRPGTITWTLTNASIALAGNWKYNYVWWLINSKDSGSFKGSVNNASITLSITLGIDATGHPTISATSCNRSISNVSLELNGTSAWKYNLFIGNLESTIKDHLQTKLCDVATRVINVRANELLKSFPLQKTVADDYVFDNRFLSAPEIQRGYVQTKQKATFYYKGDTTEPPIQAHPFPTTTTMTSDKMLTIYISDYVPNTFAYAIFRRNILRYNLTQRTLPEGFKSCLSTTCSGPCCVKNVFPVLSDRYPNASVEVELVASKAPTTNISSSSGIVVTFFGVATFRARLLDGSLVELLTVDVTLNAFATVILDSTELKRSVTKIVPSVTVLKSAVGSISADVLTKNIELLGKMFVIPQLNKKFGDGIQLPLPMNLKFKDVALEMHDHCLRIATNVEVKP